MSKTNQNLLTKTLSTYVPEILNFISTELKKEGNSLPEEGLLTGQATCDLLLCLSKWNKYKDKPYSNISDLKINDFDCFIKTSSNENTDKSVIQEKKKASLGYTHGYHGFLGALNDDTYIIYDTKAEGMLNTTRVSPAGYTTELSYMEILSKFDINCTQIGIDLETEELIVTDNFVKFYQSGQLQIAYPGTPGHSPIRLIRKATEHGFFVDLEREICKCYLVTRFFADYKELFSTKQSNCFDKYKDQMSKFCEKELFRSEEESNITYFEGEDGEIYYETDPTKERYPLYKLNFLPNNNWTKAHDFIEKIGPISSYEELSKIYNIYLYKKNNFISSFTEEREKEKEILKKTNVRYLSEALLGLYQTMQSDKDYTYNKYKLIRNLCLEHEQITVAFYEKESFAEMWDLYKLIKMLEKKLGKHVIGFFEDNAYRRGLENKDPLEYTKDYLEKEKGPLALPSFKNYEDDEWEVRELLSNLDLLIEGNKRKHCVGGYGKSIKTKKSKILSFENKIDSSKSFTMELRLVPRASIHRIYSNLHGYKDLNNYYDSVEFNSTIYNNDSLVEIDFGFFHPDESPLLFYRNTQSRGFQNGMIDTKEADLILNKVELLPESDIQIMSNETYNALREYHRPDAELKEAIFYGMELERGE